MPKNFENLQQIMHENIPYTKDKELFILNGEQINDIRREIRCSRAITRSVGHAYRTVQEQFDRYVRFDLKSRGKAAEANKFLAILEETVSKATKFMEKEIGDYA